MNAEYIAVGTELLLGDILNTNAQYISRELSAMGINLYYETVVGDNPARLSDCLDIAFARSELVILTGGLGPTYDDLTKETVARKLGVRLVLDEPSLRRVECFFARMGREMTENNKKQAMMPEGGTIFPNDWGTAPACAMTDGKRTAILLPGPPREMKPIFDAYVKPYLAPLSGGIIRSRGVRIYGMGESAVEDRLRRMMTELTNPTVAPYAKTGEVLLRVTAKADTEAAALALVDPVVERIRAELGDVVYGVDVESLEEVVVKTLAKRRLTLSAAESCTGGFIAKRITDIPGSSEVFGGSFVTYSNEMKEKLLGVSAGTLGAHGAVSPETAIEMARGARRVSGADVALGVTGIAGPGGGTEEKPVGLVYIALSAADGTEKTHKCLFGRGHGERALVRESAASFALNLVRRYLQGVL